MYTYGTYETAQAANFQIIFELCDPVENAKNPETADIKCADE